MSVKQVTAVHSRVKVLIADDDFSTRLLLSETVCSAGFTAIEADSVQAAMGILDVGLPDIAVLDVRMQDGSGYEVCRKLRALAGGRDIPILMVTGLDDLESIETAYQAGATDFITKPVHYLHLPYRLRYLLRAASAFRDAREGEFRLARVQKLARLGQWELRPSEGMLMWSPEAEHVFGLPADAVPTLSSLTRWVHADDRPRVEAIMNEGKPHHIDYRMVLPKLGERIIHQEAVWMSDGTDAPNRLIGVVQDITQQRDTERQVTKLAYFDSLTGLPNRAYLVEFLERAISAAQRTHQTIAVVALDLDLFKRVNDTYGHGVGDALLEQVGCRIRECIRGSDEVASVPPSIGAMGQTKTSVAARLGGDEFVVVLTQIRSAKDASTVAQRILTRLSHDYFVGGIELQICASIGIATYPESGQTVAELLHNADAAMYTAKDLGRSNFQFFSKEIHEQALRRLRLETGLRATINSLRDGSAGDGSMTLAFQPQLCVQSRRTIGIECLLRWALPDGPVSPAEFIQIAEDTGLIVPLGEWVLEQACRTAAAFPDLRVAVNVSARQLRDPNFVANVRRILGNGLCDPRRIDIEMTEGVVMQDTAQNLATLSELKRLGVRLSLDDFGTGYSSLSYLTRFPIDQLKIDRSFVKDIWNPANSTIVSAIIALARNLGLEIVVEGVETKAHSEFFESSGALLLQGYYYARPMSERQLREWLAECGQLPHTGPSNGKVDAPAAISERLQREATPNP